MFRPSGTYRVEIVSHFVQFQPDSSASQHAVMVSFVCAGKIREIVTEMDGRRDSRSPEINEEKELGSVCNFIIGNLFVTIDRIGD